MVLEALRVVWILIPFLVYQFIKQLVLLQDACGDNAKRTIFCLHGTAGCNVWHRAIGEVTRAHEPSGEGETGMHDQ